jgi:PQQ-dependent catabolism-associated CXXCW motif protein
MSRRAMAGKHALVALLAAAILAASSAPPAAADWVPEPEGYRLDDYRAPVPDSIKGGTVVHTAELKAMIARGGVVLIDVLPAPRRPEGMRPDAIWLPEPRRDIPGSIWLPDVGRGAIRPEVERWFRDALAAATGGDLAKPVVFYCLDQCWMSWNATKRAIAFGYRHAFWYPEGTDGWHEAGLPLAEVKPRPTP